MHQKLRIDKGKRGSLQPFDFIIGASIGLIMFFLIYGVSTLNVQYDSWIYAGYMEEDIMQRYAGWLFFRNSPWEWPLTVASNISVPTGGSIVFTDSIPLFAVFFKLFQPFLPDVFQYFGIYNLFNFVLQGGFAFLLIRQFKLGRIYAGFSTLLFVTAPVFVERAFRHDSLASQWMILAALLLYFTARHNKFPFVGFAVLAAISPTLHFYFTPMIIAILFVSLLERALKEKKILKYGLYFSVVVLSTLLVMYVFGFFTALGGGVTDEYGVFSMNLNSLLNPASRNFYAKPAYFSWSNFIPNLPQNPAQYDGFNYLGLGIIVGFLFVALSLLYRYVKAKISKDDAFIQKAKTFVRSHIWLLILCLLLTIFSISNIVVLGNFTLLEIPLPKTLLSLASIFRSSGRMFWPVTYLIYLSAALYLGKIFKKYWKTIAIVLVVIVQISDISGALYKKHRYFASGPIIESNEFTSEGWVFVAENYDTFYMMGNMFSGGLATGIVRYNPDAKTNMIITNRNPSPEVLENYSAMMDFLRSGQALQDGDLYLCSDEETFTQMLSGLHPDARGYKTGHFYMVGNPIAGCPLQEYLPLPPI